MRGAEKPKIQEDLKEQKVLISLKINFPEFFFYAGKNKMKQKKVLGHIDLENDKKLVVCESGGVVFLDIHLQHRNKLLEPSKKKTWRNLSNQNV